MTVRLTQAAPSGTDDTWWRALLLCGALLGLLTVGVGALAAHLPDRALAPGGRAMLDRAVQMQGWHVTALLAAALLAAREPGRVLPRLAGLAFGLGIVCFCAGVYATAFAGRDGWAGVVGHAAPFGGTMLMLGWLLLALCCRRPG